MKNKLQWNFNWKTTIVIQENIFENVKICVCKIRVILFSGIHVLNDQTCWQMVFFDNILCVQRLAMTPILQ